MCEVDESEGRRNERNTEAKETVTRQRICMVVRTCRRNQSSVIKNCNQLEIDWKASKEHFKMQCFKDSRNKIFRLLQSKLLSLIPTVWSKSILQKTSTFRI